MCSCEVCHPINSLYSVNVPSGLYFSFSSQRPIAQGSLATSLLGLTHSGSDKDPALTVRRDEHSHRITERPDAPFCDGCNPHCVCGVVRLDRNLSPAAILADFLRQLFLGTENKGKEMLGPRGTPLHATVPPEGGGPICIPQHALLTWAAAHRAKRWVGCRLRPRELGQGGPQGTALKGGQWRSSGKVAARVSAARWPEQD